MKQIEIINTLFFYVAAEVAKKALCKRAKCGAVVVLKGILIAQGYNAPPNDDMTNSKCHILLPRINHRKPNSDRTCCEHAEVRAIVDLLHKGYNKESLDGSIMYFARNNANGTMELSGEPYCYGCSKFALDNGVSFWALWQNDGPKLFCAKEYNDMSYAYHMKTK